MSLDYVVPYEASTIIRCQKVVVGDCTTGGVVGAVGCGYRGRLDSFYVNPDPATNGVLCPRCGSAANLYNRAYAQWIADQGKKLAEEVLREALEESAYE